MYDLIPKVYKMLINIRLKEKKVFSIHVIMEKMKWNNRKENHNIRTIFFNFSHLLSESELRLEAVSSVIKIMPTI